MAPRETENNAQVKFWGDKQRALWCVMLLSVVVNSRSNKTRHFSISKRFVHCCHSDINFT